MILSTSNLERRAFMEERRAEKKTRFFRFSFSRFASRRDFRFQTKDNRDIVLDLFLQLISPIRLMVQFFHRGGSVVVGSVENQEPRGLSAICVSAQESGPVQIVQARKRQILHHGPLHRIQFSARSFHHGRGGQTVFGSALH